MSATTVNISFQKDLLSAIDKVAKSESCSRSELLKEAARMYIERKGGSPEPGLTGSPTDATSWKLMGKVTDCDRPERDLNGKHQHGRT